MRKLATLLMAGVFVLPLTLSTLALAQDASTKGTTSSEASAPAQTGKHAKRHHGRKHSRRNRAKKNADATTTGAAK